MKSSIMIAACGIACGFAMAFLQNSTPVTLDSIECNMERDTSDLLLRSEDMTFEMSQVSYIPLMPEDDCITCHTQEQLDLHWSSDFFNFFGDQERDPINVYDFMYELEKQILKDLNDRLGR